MADSSPDSLQPTDIPAVMNALHRVFVSARLNEDRIIHIVPPFISALLGKMEVLTQANEAGEHKMRDVPIYHLMEDGEGILLGNDLEVLNGYRPLLTKSEVADALIHSNESVKSNIVDMADQNAVLLNQEGEEPPLFTPRNMKRYLDLVDNATREGLKVLGPEFAARLPVGPGKERS